MRPSEADGCEETDSILKRAPKRRAASHISRNNFLSVKRTIHIVVSGALLVGRPQRKPSPGPGGQGSEKMKFFSGRNRCKNEEYESSIEVVL